MAGQGMLSMSPPSVPEGIDSFHKNGQAYRKEEDSSNSGEMKDDGRIYEQKRWSRTESIPSARSESSDATIRPRDRMIGAKAPEGYGSEGGRTRRDQEARRDEEDDEKETKFHQVLNIVKRGAHSEPCYLSPKSLNAHPLNPFRRSPPSAMDSTSPEMLPRISNRFFFHLRSRLVGSVEYGFGDGCAWTYYCEEGLFCSYGESMTIEFAERRSS